MCNRLNIRLLLVISCFQWFKDTKMKANHNTIQQHNIQHGAVSNGSKILKLAHIRMDFAGIMQTIGIKGRYVGFTYIRPLYGFAPFWRS